MKYRKKPVVIEAFQYNGDIGVGNAPQWALDAYEKGVLFFGSEESKNPAMLQIDTLEGDMMVSLNDYVIKGVQNELYPCKPEIFLATYELVE